MAKLLRPHTAPPLIERLAHSLTSDEKLEDAGGPGVGVDNLLLEDGFNLLLESGSPDVLLLE